MPPAPARPRSALRRLLMGLVVTVGFFVGLELLLALAHAVTGLELRRRDPLTRDAATPVLCRTDRPGELRLCPNEGGFYEKTRSRSFLQKPDKKRIVAVGESFVFGLGYAEAQSWPGLLEAQLGEGVEVLNFGRCGSESTGLMPTVRAAMELQPDVLLLAIGNNEYTMTPFYSGWLGRNPRRAHHVLRVLGRVHIYGLLQTILGERIPRAAATEIRELGSHPHRAAIEAVHRGGRGPTNPAFPMSVVDPELSEILEGSKDVAELLHKERLEVMIEWAQERGVQVVMVALPRDLRARPRLSGSFGVDGDALRERITEISPLQRWRAGPSGGDRGPGVTTWAGAAQEAVAWAPRSAHLQWHLGAARWMQGERAAAIAAWVEAWQWDLSPDSTPAINRNIRELAEEHGLPLVELDVLGISWMEQEGWYYDHPPGDGELAGRHDPIHVGPDGAAAAAAAAAEVVEPLLR